MTKINIEQIHKNHPGLIYKIGFLFAFVAVFTFLALKNPKNSEAASLANFRPGNIISDYTMSNYESMTVAEIDKFLHDHGSCNNRETYKAAWYPSVHYHVKDGHFVCLADEVFAEGVEYGDLIPAGTPSRTAAQVIYDTAHTFKINPQVLLVLLEKEQGLISDSWPNSLQYRSATGFGCPDTAPCNQLYYGFVNQLDNAAYLFRTVLDGGWTNYPLGDNYIYYNPNPACGGSNVYVENLATSSLYRYTPYQPNAAALAAGYGTVSCGAYGNRNFYLFFMDWFGDPTATTKKLIDDTGYTSEEKDIVYQITKVYKNYKNELGSPISKLQKNAKSGISWIEFKNGFIVGNQKTGFYISMGEIRNVWANQKWEFGPLGFPITNLMSNKNSGIEWQEFEHGFIVGNKAHGYFISMGPTREVWVKQKWEFGPLGFPQSDIVTGADGVQKQTYEGGTIFYSKKSGAYSTLN